MANPTSNPEFVTVSDIVKFANTVAKSIRSRLSWSAKLRGTVEVGTPNKKKDYLSIKISVGGKDRNLRGMARAFEYGSGIHATRGKVGKYIIRPRFKKALAFHWKGIAPGTMPIYRKYNQGQKIIGQLPDGRLLFNYVEHPGVEPRPYIHPAYEAIKKKAGEDMALSVRNNIKNELAINIKALKSQLK